MTPVRWIVHPSPADAHGCGFDKTWRIRGGSEAWVSALLARMGLEVVRAEVDDDGIPNLHVRRQVPR